MWLSYMHLSKLLDGFVQVITRYLQSYDMLGGERGGDAVGRAKDHRL